MGRLAILAGQGALPQQIARAHGDALFVHFQGLAVDLPANQAFRTSYERFGEMFDGLEKADVTEVVFAGGLARPALNPANFDAKMAELAPRFLAAMQGGDDGLLRTVIATFEEHGFAVRGAHELLPGLTLAPGPMLPEVQPTPAMERDGARGAEIVETLGALDLGQACVVAGGTCLGIETAQGTAAMLRCVRDTRAALPNVTGGVLVKRPKPGQDLRVDMPAIGPDTVDQARDAGLGGICVKAGQVIVLDAPEMRRRSLDAGLAIWATVG